MTQRCKVILLPFLVLVAVNAWAIDKGQFTKLRPDTAERVLLSFQGPAYYLATEPGGHNLGESFDKQPPFASLPFKHAILLFLDRNDAVTWAQQAQEQSNNRYSIKAINLNRVLFEQYKTIHAPLSKNPQNPDLIVVETLARRVPVVETFVHTKTLQPFVYQDKGKRFIPAFLSRADAAAFEPKVKAAGPGSFVRQSLEIRTHLALVERYVNSATPVITFGYDASRWMQVYVDGIAK